MPDVARFLLVNVYCAYDDRIDFCKNLFNLIDSYDIDNLIIVGDWNTVLNLKVDTRFNKQKQTDKVAAFILDYMQRKGLVDIWRKNFPSSQKFTWSRQNPIKFGRLDFFLMSSTMLPLYTDSNILTSYRSDHSPIILILHIQKNPKGAGFWKINNSHLLNENLNQAIKDEILLKVQTYACTPYHPDFVKNFRTHEIDIMIDIKLFWDIFHTQLRGLLITYAGNKKREQNLENLLNKKN